MPVGIYEATLHLAEADYCGRDFYSTKDSITARVVPDPVFVKIRGGTGSAIYAIPASVLVLNTTINYPMKIKKFRWDCRLHDHKIYHSDISSFGE